MDSSNSTQVRQSGVESIGLNPQQYPRNQTTAQQNSSKAPYPWNLTNFYMSMNDTPWVPRGIIPTLPPDAQTNQNLSPTVGFPTNTPAFQNYRNRPLPSECETCPEDSGYGGSRAPYSIENTSVYDDEPNPDTHNTAQLIDSLHLGVNSISNNQLSVWPPARQTPSIATAPASGEHKHYCADCGNWLRTKSELNKHHSRHNKPYNCDVAGCNRKEGFGTRNDLDRHKRSVHADLSVSGPRYICHLDQCATRGPSKLWPRADNFRSHLRRIHQKFYSADDDLEEYIYRDVQISNQDISHMSDSHAPRQPALREDLQGVGGTALSFHPSFIGNQSMTTDCGQDIPDLHQDLESMLQSSGDPSSENNHSVLPPDQEVDEELMQSDMLNGSGEDPSHSHQSFHPHLMSLSHFQYQGGTQGDDDSTHMSSAIESSENDAEGSDCLETDITPPDTLDTSQLHAKHFVIKTADPESKPPSPKPDSISKADLLRLLSLDQDTDAVLKCLRNLPKELLKSALNDEADDDKSAASSQESLNQKSSYQCSECPKTFNRQCELRKHLKRHEKPYGCTFPNCLKAFGSKNDWKRHESSQHWHLETWKCEEVRLNQNERCAKSFQRRESFKNHLNKDHDMTDSKQVEEKLDRCRVGRHCDTRFWCGFCKMTIEIKNESGNAWTKRCNHIDDHFCGRDGKKMNISEWKHDVNDEKTPSEACTEACTEPSSEESSSSPSSSPVSTTPYSLKRKISTDEDAGPPRKRPQGTESIMWTCCECQGDNNWKTTSSMCFHCNHSRCRDGCEVTMFDCQDESM